ncbi:MAG: bifunctional phosphopantothenoylcysteine decarboxylase/phosphopantothenate--cysteine ligase CoaBC [Gaiellaceae bacterium]|jgi:phosphopantothenoylcysteine decarboxylase/phosphopantothenate--cysteine ligase
MAKILVGVSGGIAAYKACELVRLFVKAGHEVVPLLTPAAEKFVSRKTLDALARRLGADSPYPHLERADLYVIAPATANTLAKLASGIADNLVTESALAHSGPLVLAPAMNARMWANPATQENVRTLRERGAQIVGPEEGELGEGGSGVGRMSEPKAIFERCRQILAVSSSLAGIRVLVSAGGTREPLDSVRFLGNRSSGRMGVALAAEAARRGAEVTLVAANLAVPAPAGVELIEVQSAAALAEAMLGRDDDIILMSAAVADYKPAVPEQGKRRKSEQTWTVELEPTTDVLRELGARRRKGQLLVGFAADEGDAGLERAREKRSAKKVDLMVFNDITQAGIGFDADENEVTLISETGERVLARAPKSEIAAGVLDEVERLRGGSG